MRAARGLTDSLFTSNKPADLKKAINPLQRRPRPPGPRLIRITLVPMRAGRDLIVQAKVGGFLGLRSRHGSTTSAACSRRRSTTARLSPPNAWIPACAGMTMGLCEMTLKMTKMFLPPQSSFQRRLESRKGGREVEGMAGFAGWRARLSLLLSFPRCGNGLSKPLDSSAFVPDTALPPRPLVPDAALPPTSL